MVCEQTCSCGLEMDKSLWQTFGAFDLWYSSHMWIQAILFCWKHGTTMQIRIVSRLWFCRRSRRLKINIRRGSVHFRKSQLCTDQLDVQEANFSVTQFNGSWSNFSRCRFTHGWDSRSRSLEFSDWSIHSSPNQTNETKDVRGPRGNPSANTQPNMRKQIPDMRTNLDLTNIDHVSSSVNTLWFQCYVVCLRGQWSLGEDDNKRPKSHNETCVKNPQSCFGLVVWHD